MRRRDLNMNSKYIVWRKKKVLENKETHYVLGKKTLVAKDQDD